MMARRELGFLAVAVLLLNAPFLNKPFHIDDTFVLHIAGNILQNPLDPFAGDFDWFGYNRPVFDSTTNPPLISYYLAPFAYWLDYSETALHSAMLLFYLLFAVGAFLLSKRFCGHAWLALLFALGSPAAMVSGNVMRDVPAAALATFGIALFVAGSDRDQKLEMLLGSLVAGLAIITKYSSVIVLPVLALYPLLKRRPAQTIWAAPALVFLLIWCLHNYVVYDAVHIVYLTLQRRSEAGIGWDDKLCGALAVVGCACFLAPFALWRMIQEKMRAALCAMLVLIPGALWFVQSHFEGNADAEYLFWAGCGATLLVFALLTGARRLGGLVRYGDESSDTLFLCAWLCAPVLFSVLLVPFQATRHLILALPPLCILALRRNSQSSKPTQSVEANQSGQPIKAEMALLGVLLSLQIGVGFLVHAADYEFASAYRTFARTTSHTWKSPGQETWFLGHWGWQHYASREGHRQIHGGEAMPQTGDIIFRPTIAPVDLPNVFEGNDAIEERMDLIDEIAFPGQIPARVMNWDGASFYAVIGAWGTPNMPYRLFQRKAIETIRVYQVEGE